MSETKFIVFELILKLEMRFSKKILGIASLEIVILKIIYMTKTSSKEGNGLDNDFIALTEIVIQKAK